MIGFQENNADPSVLSTEQQLHLRVLARMRSEAMKGAAQRIAEGAPDSQQAATQLEMVEAATAHPYLWVLNHTQTYNPHWKEERRASPYEPFPRDLPYMGPLFELMLYDERILLIEKSRDMMVSWACVAYFTWQAMKVPERTSVFQTQEKGKVVELIDYAKCLWDRQDGRLKEAFPLAKPLTRQSAFSLEFANGSGIYGIPSGKGKIRSYHPWGYLNDESSFQPAAGECYDESLAAVAGKIIFNSTAGPGWYADFRRDITREAEE